MDYVLLQTETYTAMTIAVRGYLKKGYIPFGSPSTVTQIKERSSKLIYTTVYIQAVIKHK